MTRRSRVGCELATSSTEVHNVMASHRTLYEILLLCFYLHFAPHVKSQRPTLQRRIATRSSVRVDSYTTVDSRSTYTLHVKGTSAVRTRAHRATRAAMKSAPQPGPAPDDFARVHTTHSLHRASHV